MWIKDKQKYTLFCKEHQSQLPIFFQSWWLDIVCCDGVWLPYISADGCAICPIFIKKKWGLRYLTMPKLTYKLGVWASPSTTENKYSFVSVLKILPSGMLYILQNIPNSQENKIELEHSKIAFIEYFHFMYLNPSNENEIEKKFNRLAKRELKVANIQLKVNKTESSQLLYSLFSRSLRRNNYLKNIEFEIIEKLCKECEMHECGGIWSSKDENNAVHSVLFFVWNQQMIYFIMTGIDDRIKQIGGIRNLHWAALQLAAASGKSIDLCGGMAPNFASVFSSMGAEKYPYIHIEHYPNFIVKNIVRLAKKIKNIAH